MKQIFGLAMAVCFAALIFTGCKGKSERSPQGGTAPNVDMSAFREAETLKKIVENDPGNVAALIKLGNIYFDTNQNEEAVKSYRKALEFDQNNADVRTDMAICLRRLRRTDEAISEFKKASQSNPRHYQSRYNLGLTLLHDKNDLQGAIDAWDALVREVPEFPGRERLVLQLENLKQVQTPVPEEKNDGSAK